MKLAEYDDEDLINEIKHRGLKIELRHTIPHNLKELMENRKQVLIGGVVFDIK